jgi:hypothetical protein
MKKLAWRCLSALERVRRLDSVRPVVEYKAVVMVQVLVEYKLVLYIAEVVWLVVEIVVEPAQVEGILAVQRVPPDLRIQPGVPGLVVGVAEEVPS